MESCYINYEPGKMRDISGRVIETKRQNPTTKPVIKKPLTNTTEMTSISNKEARSTAVTSPTLAEVKAKMASGQKLTNEETLVLLDHIRKTGVPKGFVSPKIGDPDYLKSQKHKPSESAKTEFPPKIYPSATELYLQQQEKSRQIENAANTRSTLYRPLDNKVKGGFERAIDKMHQLGETKAELAERSAKMAEKFAKLLEFCKKYGKSIKA